MTQTYTRWTPERDTLLRDQYPVAGPVAVARLLGLSANSVRCRARRLGLAVRRLWTPDEERRVRDAYGRVPVSRLAADLGRTPAAVAQMAVRLGVADCYGKRPEWSPGLEARYRELHAAGYSDAEMVRILGGDRPWLNAHRRRLGLPPNRHGERFRAKMRANLRRQLERAGAATFAELRHRKTRELCRSYGLPEDLAARELQIVLALVDGPKTKSEVCSAIGLTARPGNRSALNCGDGSRGRGWNYLSRLTLRGLVTRVRVPGVNSKRGLGEQWLFLLTAVAMDMLAKGGRGGDAAAQG